MLDFAWVLTRVDASYSIRTFAAYGGVYVAAALVLLVVVDRVRRDRWAGQGEPRRQGLPE